MLSIKALAAATIALLALQGCAGVATVAVGSEGDEALGPVYFLPTTEIPLFVSVHPEDGWIAISASDPIYRRGSDPLRLRSLYSPLHAETFHPKINAAGLLTEITYDSDGRIDETLVNLGKSFGAIAPQNAPINEDGSLDVFSAPIDVAALATRADGTVPAAMTALNKRINKAIKSASGPLAKGLLKTDGTETPPVTLSVVRLARDPAGGASGLPAPDCGVGFCYRLPVPYRITADFANGTHQSRYFAVPNGSRTYAAALNRGAFSKWSNKVVFSNGMLQEYKYVTEGSEAERLAALPFEVVGGFIDGITRKGALFDAQSSRIASQIALADAKKKAQGVATTAQSSLVTQGAFFVMAAGRTGKRQIGQQLVRPADVQGTGPERARSDTEDPDGTGATGGGVIEGPGGRTRSGSTGTGG